MDDGECGVCEWGDEDVDCVKGGLWRGCDCEVDGHC